MEELRNVRLQPSQRGVTTCAGWRQADHRGTLAPVPVGLLPRRMLGLLFAFYLYTAGLHGICEVRHRRKCRLATLFSIESSERGRFDEQ